MKARDITEFLKELQNRRVPSKVINGWVSMPCPLAPWTHRNTEDKHPSFGVKVQDKGDKVSIFNCYTCKKKGPLSHLATLYQNFSGQDKSHLIDEAEDIELFGVQLPLWEERNDAEPHMLAPDALGVEYEDIFEQAWATGIVTDNDRLSRNGNGWVHPYLLTRGIMKSATEYMDICVDADDGHGDERIVFAVRGVEGELYGYTGRATQEEVNPRIRDYYGLPKRACLLGAHLIGAGHLRPAALLPPHPVILCEGLFDYARLVQCRHLAVAAMHSGLTELQANILREAGRPVVLMYDNDEAGRSGNKLAKRLLQDYVPLQKVRYPEGKEDPGSLTVNEIGHMLMNSRVA